MSLELAGLLDQVAPFPQWSDQTLKSLNSALLTSRTVTPGYNLMITIAGRSYVFTSDAMGKLQVTIPGPGRETMNALKMAQARIIIETSAMKDFDTTKSGWDEALLESRMLRMEGDIGKLDKFQGDVASFVKSVSNKVVEAGPGQRTIDQAVEDYIHKLNFEEVDAQETWDNALQMAMLSDKEISLTIRPEMGYIWGVLRFSTMTTMFGSVGQNNYNACNGLLDLHSFQERIYCKPEYYPVTHMWGGVGEVGMREKTFGSKDVLLQGAESMLLTPAMCMGILRCIFYGNLIGVEWECGSLMDEPTRNFLNDPKTGPPRDPDPWQLGKGAKSVSGNPFGGMGGGLSFDGEVAADKFSQSKPRTGLIAGRRVRLHGLQSAPEMNGKIGSLMRETEEGKWQVRLDDDLGDKILKVKNLQSLTGQPLDQEPALVAAKPSVDFCVAGTWSKWVPHDMQYNDQEQCATLDVELDGDGPATFSFSKGKAGTKAWKSTGRQQWTLGDTKGVYRIKLFLKPGGLFKSVDVQRLGDIKAAGPEGAVNQDQLTGALRRILTESCPWWTDSDLTAVQEKFAKVQICSVGNLLENLPKINELLTNAGEKALSGKALQALRERTSLLN